MCHNSIQNYQKLLCILHLIGLLNWREKNDLSISEMGPLNIKSILFPVSPNVQAFYCKCLMKTDFSFCFVMSWFHVHSLNYFVSLVCQFLWFILHFGHLTILLYFWSCSCRIIHLNSFDPIDKSDWFLNILIGRLTVIHLNAVLWNSNEPVTESSGCCQ